MAPVVGSLPGEPVVSLMQHPHPLGGGSPGGIGGGGGSGPGGSGGGGGGGGSVSSQQHPRKLLPALSRALFFLNNGTSYSSHCVVLITLSVVPVTSMYGELTSLVLKTSP